MNVKLLRRVKKHILEEPKRLVMSYLTVRKEDELDRQMLEEDRGGGAGRFPKCGTAACIAGWANILSGSPRAGMPHARTLLRITEKQANRLFNGSWWPVEFIDGASDDGKKKTAKIAAARIEHFIATKGQE